MQRALFIIFALWGSVKLLDITYTHLIRPALVNQAPKKRPPPAPYTAADRARDAARAAWLQREGMKNPTIARELRRRSEERARMGAHYVN